MTNDNQAFRKKLKYIKFGRVRIFHFPVYNLINLNVGFEFALYFTWM